VIYPDLPFVLGVRKLVLKSFESFPEIMNAGEDRQPIEMRIS
jgi:hypothetical protein